MWNRAELKYKAKQELKISYWTPFLVCLVGGMLGGTGGGGSVSGFSAGSSRVINDLSDYISFGSFVLFSLIVLCFMIFISNPVSVGISHYFIRAPFGQRDFGILFSSFQNGRYTPIVKGMLLTDLYIFLWSLLFIIPGIIKSYEYRMVPYLLADHPYLTPNEAMAISREMTMGHKMEMFILDLSFIGWLLLGTLLLGVGVLFVVPYIEATFAQLYFVLRPTVQVPNPPSFGYGI